jgi:hypothetical protein
MQLAELSPSSDKKKIRKVYSLEYNGTQSCSSRHSMLIIVALM